MRRLILAVLLSVTLSVHTGCLVPTYSPIPARRTRQLIFSAEDLRVMSDTWERIWFRDMPDHETPFRVHGGII